MANLFEMGANFDDGWGSDNKNKASVPKNEEYKAPHKHQLYFSKEKRRGKIVTIVRPFYLEKQDLQNLLKSLKKNLGCGGTSKEDSLELQGDIAENLAKQLKVFSYTFKH